jgi:ribosomal protein L32
MWKTPEELAISCGVSVPAATIRFERFSQTRDRKHSGENVRKLAEAFKQEVCPTTAKIHYADMVCNRCGQHTVIPVGVKFLCITCEAVTDNFQDGDPIGD